MAVLKSFELKGNKLSFANWISNLSPTSTPFTSMIGKEAIGQTQYSWQTDSLAPASSETFLEGSQASSQPRAVTKVHTNFTSTLRKAVKISDTNSSTDAYGRKSEIAYQMGKAGKELIRDVEASNLSKKIGNIGKDGDPSVFTGFNFLCGPMYDVDQDTKAITHQGVSIISPDQPWFSMKDIFEITSNLYLAGSKADKIMFHPRHINIFSDILGFNEESPNVHRLFDALDDKFNMKVFQIKDPIGRLYSLIPNRNMPETAVYFFNENDWTQMVLREPQRIQLAKKGSYTSAMIETEVGLRHKHPHASGVLELQTVNFEAHLSVDQSSVSTLPGEFAGFLIHLLHKDLSPVQNMDFKVMLSDESIATLSSHAGQTNAAGSATFDLVGKKPGRVSVYVYGYDTAREFVSNAIVIDFVDPQILAGVDDTTMALGERISAQTRVFDPVNGYLAQDGTEITWHSNSDQVVFVDNVSGDFIGPTALVPTKNGVSAVKIAAKAAGEYEIWSSFKGIVSNKIGITVLTAGLKFHWNTKSIFTAGLSKNEPMNVTISDRHGVALPDGTKVEWKIENGSRGALSAPATTTTTGVSVNNFTAETSGETYIILSVHGDEFKHKISCVDMKVDTVLQDSNTIGIGKTATLQSFVEDADGNPVPNATVHWTSYPTSFGELNSTQGTTDANGKAETTFKGLTRGSGEITASIERVDLSTTPFYIGMGAEVDFRIIPNPGAIGEERKCVVVVTGKDGSYLPDVEVSFSSDPFIGDLSGMTGKTLPNGSWEASFTPVVGEDSSITANLDCFEDLDTELLEFNDATYIYDSADSTNITIGLGKDHTFVTTVTNDKGAPVGNVSLEYTVSDSSKVSFKALNDSKTNGNGQSTLHITPLSKGSVDISVKVKGKSNTRTFNMEIKDPVITFTINPNPVQMNEWATVGGSVIDADGNGVQGVTVSFSASPSMGAEVLIATPKLTDIDGNYSLDWKVLSNSDYEIYSYVKDHPSVQSDIVNLKVSEHALSHTISGHEKPIVVGLGTTHNIQATVTDLSGNPVRREKVLYHTVDDHLVSLSPLVNGDTNSSGISTLVVEGRGVGVAKITSTLVSTGVVREFDLVVSPPDIKVVVQPNPTDTTSKTNFRVEVRDLEGNPQVGVNVHANTTANVGTIMGPALTLGDGSVTFDRWVGAPGTFTANALLQDMPHVVGPNTEFVVKDRHYDIAISQKTGRATVGYNWPITFTVTENGVPASGVGLSFNTLNPELVPSPGVVYTDSKGVVVANFQGRKVGTAAVQVKVASNVASYTDFHINFGNVTLDLLVNKGVSLPYVDVEFAVTIRDANWERLPNTMVDFHWTPGMFPAGNGLMSQMSDSQGNVIQTRKVHGIGTYQVYASGGLFTGVKSQTRTLYVQL